jgi:hypothetical protein
MIQIMTQIMTQIMRPKSLGNLGNSPEMGVSDYGFKALCDIHSATTVDAIWDRTLPENKKVSVAVISIL